MNRFILDGLQAIIKWDEYDMVIAGQAGNGVDALDYLRINPVDILITDITMPLMNGLELIQNIKTNEFRYQIYRFQRLQRF